MAYVRMMNIQFRFPKDPPIAARISGEFLAVFVRVMLRTLGGGGTTVTSM